jgi:hypothetical protein
MLAISSSSTGIVVWLVYTHVGDFEASFKRPKVLLGFQRNLVEWLIAYTDIVLVAIDKLNFGNNIK